MMLQWLEAILLLIVGFYPAIVIIELTYVQLLYALLFILYLPVGQFTTAPFFKLTGIYTYYSPMLLGYMANKAQIDLHSGGSFDYLWVMRKFRTRVESRNALLCYHLEGLLQIIYQIEGGLIPKTVILSGTSYFFNERTLARLGFRYEAPSIFYRINLLANFIDLTWMYSLSQGRFGIPTLWKAKKATITGGALVDQKAVLTELYQRMTSRTKMN